MSQEKPQNKKEPAQQKQGIRNALEGILERLRQGLEDVSEAMRPRAPQPIPIPAGRPRRR